MKTAAVSIPKTALMQRFSDYVQLTKPKIAILVLFTVAAGFCMASAGRPDLILLVHTLIGAGLLAAGASALNQYYEIQIDGKMRRTAKRPLPTRRLRPIEALLFGLGTGLLGLLYLWFVVQKPLCVVVAAVTYASYVWVYTPLKKYTTLNTFIGAIPGALPPVIGWTAVTDSVDLRLVTLFGVLFLWQIPHFLSIAWLCRDEYRQAGLQMIPGKDPKGLSTGVQMVLYCAGLLGVSFLPLFEIRIGLFEILYVLAATLFGAIFLFTTIRFLALPSDTTAKTVLRGSLLHLPVLMGFLAFIG
ncbi:MAG: heme o synthase [Gemmataceae bacterium]